MSNKETKFHPIDIYVGNRLKLMRLMSGIGREKLGESVELSGEQIRKYESGANRISASKLYQIGAFFGKNVSFFFEGYTDNSKKSQLVNVDDKLYLIQNNLKYNISLDSIHSS
jgi:transcriptional regulator with XRE-family HTH domain